MLPSEFNIDNSGNVKIDSYINNLDIKEVELYKIISNIFSKL